MDSLSKQDLSLAVARALAGYGGVPTEVSGLDYGRYNAPLLEGPQGRMLDSVDLGDRLLRELDRLGYTLVRNP